MGGGLSPLNDAAAPLNADGIPLKSYLFIHIHGLLQLASKRVLSGSDCLKIDGGWGFAPDPTGELTVLQLGELTVLPQTP